MGGEIRNSVHEPPAVLANPFQIRCIVVASLQIFLQAQVVLPRMKNDIIEVMEACVNGTLDQIDLQFEDNAAVCVVLASDGYPVHYEKGLPISGLEAFDGKDDYFVFHAGTKKQGDTFVTNGGRVLGVTATGKDLKEARSKAYQATEWISFDNKYMRHDIGKAIDEA